MTLPSCVWQKVTVSNLLLVSSLTNSFCSSECVLSPFECPGSRWSGGWKCNISIMSFRDIILHRHSRKPRKGRVERRKIISSKQLILCWLILWIQSSKKGYNFQFFPLSLPCCKVLRIRLVQVKLLPFSLYKTVMLVVKTTALFSEKLIFTELIYPLDIPFKAKSLLTEIQTA